MGNAEVDITIDRPADEVWKVAGDFAGLGDWMPGIESCRVEGDDRHLSMSGMELTETLVSKDDQARTLVYSITKGLPLERHSTTLKVEPQGAGSRVSMVVDVEPGNLAEVFTGTYAGALAAMKEKIEGS